MDESVIPKHYLDVLYVPENPSPGTPGPYQWNDFLNIASGNVEYAMSLVDRCTWQHPETLCDEDEREGEIVCVGGEYMLTGGEDRLESMAHRLWDELGDVCIDDNDCIETAFYGFPAGTHREEIWHWFEDAFAEQGITVHGLMYPDEGKTLRALLIPTGEPPREVGISAADSLHDLQEYVGGHIEPLDVLGGGITLYVNDEGLGTLPPNRALYATREMEHEGYLSQMDFSHVAKEGELYTILFGNIVAVSYDDEGELQDLPHDQFNRLTEQFRDPSTGMREVAGILRRRHEPSKASAGSVSLDCEAKDMRRASDALGGNEPDGPKASPER